MSRTAYDVIIRPIISEQSMEDMDIKKYVFEVAKDATKVEIAKAVEEIFGVRVIKVNTLHVRGRSKRVGAAGKTLVVNAAVDEKVIKSARNIAGVQTTIATILSPYAVLNNTKLVVDREALAKIEEVYA